MVIMNTNRRQSFAKNHCGPCMKPYNQGTMLPEYEIQKCDSHTCETYVNDPNGVGLGRYSANNEACNTYPTENGYSCCASANDLENYYTINEVPSLKRNTLPSGGVSGQGGDPQAYNL